MPENKLGEIKALANFQNGVGRNHRLQSWQRWGRCLFLTSGLEQWEQTAKVKRALNPTQTSSLNRLQKNSQKLFQDVSGDSWRRPEWEVSATYSRYTFSKWLTCPSCNRLAEAREFGSELAPLEGCSSCTKKRGVFMLTNKIYRSVWKWPRFLRDFSS